MALGFYPSKYSHVCLSRKELQDSRKKHQIEQKKLLDSFEALQQQVMGLLNSIL